MIIQKIKTQVGWWEVKWRNRDGELFIACSDNKIDAINRMFEKLRWAEIGNWNG